MLSSHLQVLESESIFILREVAAEFQRPVLLYSAGKDSSVLLRLAQKAFYPGKIPFPLMHIDTGFKFQEMYEFRDQIAANLNAELIVYRNEDAISQNANPFALGTQKCCSLLKTKALLDGIRSRSFDVAIGGARRDEEKSRAKERIFSVRNEFGQWDPHQQRPEFWNLFNTKISPGETIRAFPLSNWTELDVWNYISEENIPVVSLYFAKKRKMLVRGSQLIPADGRTPQLPGEKPAEVLCRFRTLGCSPCTGAVRSSAATVNEIVAELSAARFSERMGRVIDHDAEGSMEMKKREGYF